MQFQMTVQMDNAAFADDDGEHDGTHFNGAELARILKKVASRVEDGTVSGICVDINGNKVGEFDISE